MRRHMTSLLLGLAVIGAAAALLGVARRTSLAAGRAASALSAMPHDSVARLSPLELRDWLRDHPDAVLLDVRTPAEFADGHLAGAMNLDVQDRDFAERAGALAKGVPYVVYCRSGARSQRAGTLMLGLGHAPVVNAGGFEPLAREGFATDRGDAPR